MRVLVTTSALEGHFFPLVPLAWALRAAGHDVLVSAPANMNAKVTASGLNAAGTVGPVLFDDFMLSDRAGQPLQPPKNAEERTVHAGHAWGRLAAMTLAGHAEAFRIFRPDLVISEPNEYAGRMLADHHGVPWVEQSWGNTGMPEFNPWAARELDPELAGLGLDGLSDPVTFIDTCPPCLAEPGDRTGLPMRYVPYNGSATAPEWVHRPRTRKRVCLSMGSILPRHGRGDFRGMLQEWSVALTAIGVEVVVAVADDLAGQWNPRPAGVVAAGWMPMGLVLPACDALLHHGGPGATLTAVLNGVPQVIVPQIVDQFTCARQMLNAGAGLRLLREELSTAAAVEACERVLSEPSFAENARGVARSNATRPTPAETVPVLEAIAESGRLDVASLGSAGIALVSPSVPGPGLEADMERPAGDLELAHSGASTLMFRSSAASRAGLDHPGPASSPAGPAGSAGLAGSAGPARLAGPAQADTRRG